MHENGVLVYTSGDNQLTTLLALTVFPPFSLSDSVDVNVPLSLSFSPKTHTRNARLYFTHMFLFYFIRNTNLSYGSGIYF